MDAPVEQEVANDAWTALGSHNGKRMQRLIDRMQRLGETEWLGVQVGYHRSPMHPGP
jgi:hypothetical protein